ncbi:TIM barrel protein [Runella sp. CRIBMP]|uniref:sugar phosphate isomerase/epimerase family protein n=1 Tax=Runella sp. CRIBMP TaxID=2683261 RepID=UPI0014136E8D|nr:sugar phosphate isomerase/epimerase [Runella sp. CRIBMP]NBB22750.1 TIM barrel protein [Runella sp. CRIBMP]
MQNRRTFLKNTSALALGSLAVPALAKNLFAPEALPRPGLQLFTLFRAMSDDAKGSLEKVAGIGYKEIESAFSMKDGYYGYSPKEFKKVVEDLGMTWRAHHVGGAPFRPRPAQAGAPAGGGAAAAGAPPRQMPANMPKRLNLLENYQQLVDEAAEGGLTYLVCASTPVGTLDEIKKSIEVFVKTGEACKKAGIGFAYHNHATEFDKVEGQTPYDLILSQTSPDLVTMEMDMAWVVKAGLDPVELFKQQPGRFPLWHIKDIDKELKKPVEVGTGVVDFKKIFSGAQKAGLKYYFVEQDMAASPFESIATSFANLQKLTA